MKRNEKIVLRDLISELKDRLLTEGEQALTANEDWFVYFSEDDVLTADTEVLIADPVDVDEDEWEEILPAIAEELDMTVSFSGELLDNVVINALRQSKAVSDAELIEALNYYIETDDFMEIA